MEEEEWEEEEGGEDEEWEEEEWQTASSQLQPIIFIIHLLNQSVFGPKS